MAEPVRKESETEPSPRLLLYLPFRRLPEDSTDIIERLASISGIHSGDIRYKLVGIGLRRFTPLLPASTTEDLARELDDMGIPAGVVPEEKIKRRLKLPMARRVEINYDSMVFFDKNDDAVFTVDKNTELLAVVADLSGRAIEKPLMGIHMDKPAPGRSFEESIKRFSMAKPVAVLCRIGGDSPHGVIISPSSFAYTSMDDYMHNSSGVNFRTLLTETMDRAGSVIKDHHFGAAALAGARPDWKGGKQDILKALGRYTLYLLGAVEAGIIRHGGPAAADDVHEKKNPADADNPDNLTSGGKSSGRPEPPPPISNSATLAGFSDTPLEYAYVLLICAAPFLSIFASFNDFNNPVLWKTLTGIGLLCTGLVLFPYSLVVLHYKRMVENTPTSRVRSMAMGTAELQGRARQYYDLATTHSQTRCVYYRCRYYRRVRTRDGNKWKLVNQVYSGRLPFYLEDETGRVLVRPEGALFHISQTRQEFAGAESMWLPVELRQNKTRIYEDLIPEGARIYVLGTARPEKVGGSLREKIINRLGLLKKDRDRLMRYDSNNDGRIDMGEWEVARRDIENKVYAESLADNRPTEQIVIKKPAYGLLPFIIADSEEGILRKLSLRVWIFLAGGLTMIGLGVEMLIRVFEIF